VKRSFTTFIDVVLTCKGNYCNCLLYSSPLITFAKLNVFVLRGMQFVGHVPDYITLFT